MTDNNSDSIGVQGLGAIPGSRERGQEVVPALTGFDPARELYSFTNGWTMKREARHLWHLRDKGDGLIEFDRYRHDLISRWNLDIAFHHDPLAIAIEAATAGETGNTDSTEGKSAGRLRHRPETGGQ